MADRPEEQMTSALAARGGMRASDAERDQVVEFLTAAFTQERLSPDELAVRTGRALAARTWAELAAVTAGLPEARRNELAHNELGGVVARRGSGKKVAVRAAGVIVAAGVIASFFTFFGGFIVLFVLAFLFATLAAPPGARR